ncbi:MAG: hypothetical protein RBT33_02405 [Candidatus Dojkabacteria bacterium]|jgi:hypothetical protein|nr:hypothetical protein [Candidatus Dojkabacteria bacterium]
MNKKKNFFLVSILAIGILALFNTPVLADGYSPYQPHIPEETGLIDGMIFNIVAVISYLSGIASIGLAKFLSSKIG